MIAKASSNDRQQGANNALNSKGTDDQQHGTEREMQWLNLPFSRKSVRHRCADTPCCPSFSRAQTAAGLVRQ
jgi:hypothetical protein